MIKYPDKFSLKKKVIFVAGGCGLIGAEICRGVASLGAKVIILDTQKDKGQDLQRQIKHTGGKAVFEMFDVTDLASVEKNMKILFVRHGGMHAWINASYPRTKDWPKPLEAMTIEYLRGNVDAHLNSFLWTSRQAAFLMKKHKVAGSIVNFGSIYGVQANDLRIYEGTAMCGEMIYCAVKGGIINMTKYLASHFGACGIRANSICPGGVWAKQDPKFVARYESRTLLKRMAKPEDIASVVAFLVSDAAGYITGETVMVDAGWTAV